MIRSMTGYGEAECESPIGRLRLEVKTVNHRFFNTSIKTPSGFDKFEGTIIASLKRHLFRGHVNAFLSIDRSGQEVQPSIEVDLDRGRAIQTALDLVRNQLGLSGEVDLEMVARHGNLFRASEGDRAAGIESELIADLSDSAAISVRVLREAEGERLETDLSERLDAIAGSLSLVEARAPKRLTEYRERLQQAVIELSEQVQVEDERLAREVAYLAERWDINEELVRFRSHVDLFRETLTGDGSEPVGKRLGFLTQEMNREANTIGSKANDIEVSRASVALKEEIERIREQVENVE